VEWNSLQRSSVMQLQKSLVSIALAMPTMAEGKLLYRRAACPTTGSG
jgi:hypothetical protein